MLSVCRAARVRVYCHFLMTCDIIASQLATTRPSTLDRPRFGRHDNYTKKVAE